MESTWKNKILVASLYYGTNHSGYALSFLSDYENDKTKHIFTHKWKSEDHPSTTTTPTCILLKPDKTFHSFGYEAEKKYASLFEADTHKQWHYFPRFMMKLIDNKTHRPLSLVSLVQDAEGRDFSALTVFTYSIEYLKNTIIEKIQENAPYLIKDEIYYVLITPAIWSERSKLFMRTAAENAKIPSDHLRIASKPECVAAYVKTKELPLLAAGSSSSNKTLSPSSCSMIIDVGGRTLDITAYRVSKNYNFEEIITPDVGPWGGDRINLKFEGFLISLVGGAAFYIFKEKHREEYLDLQRQFELKKCDFEYEEDGVITMRISKALQNLHAENNLENLTESIRQTRYAKCIKIVTDKMKINSKTFLEFFSETVDSILTKVECILDKIPDQIDTLICVGDLSNCKLINQRFRERFHDKTVIIPNEAFSSIMKGAIIYGRDTSIIEPRLCRYTYGLAWNEDFDPKIHPLSKREVTDNGYMCKDIFFKLISKNDLVSTKTSVKEIEAYTKWKHQTVIDFPFYRSELFDSPKFIDDMGCELVGTLSICLPDSNHDLEQSVKLKVYFGDTELKAEVIDKMGKKYQVTLNLSETQVQT